MRKLQLLIVIVTSSLLNSMLLTGCSWQKPFLQANPAIKVQQSETTSVSNPSPDDFKQLKLTPEQIDQLSEKLANELANELAKPEPSPYKLCSSNSDGYLKFPLREVDPLFRACADDLLKLTHVPLVLPDVVPKSFEGKKLHAFFYIPFTKANRYYIGLTWKPEEYYQAERAWFEGEKLTPRSPTLVAYYQKESAFAESSPFHRNESSPVRLTYGIQGYYIPAVCGANCHSAYGSVMWDQGGYRYRIGIKMARKAEVLEIVNAAIKNQQL